MEVHMEGRKANPSSGYLPTFKSLELITPETFQQRITEVEALLKFKEEQLSIIFDARTSLELIESEITKITTSSIDTLNNMIIEYTTADTDNEYLSVFMNEKRAELLKKLQTAREKLLHIKDETIDQHKAEIEKTRNILLANNINAGNYQLALDTFKFNVIVALQSAAARLHLTINNINTLRFNQIFRGLARINADGSLTHNEDVADHIKGDLISLQQLVDGIIQDCRQQGEDNLLKEIKLHLDALNHLNLPSLKGQPVIHLYDNHIRFANSVYQLEQQSNTACGLALAAYDALITNEDEAINGFRGTTFITCDPLRTLIAEADDDIEAMKTSIREGRHDNPIESNTVLHSSGVTPLSSSPKPRADIIQLTQPKFWQTPTFKRGMIGAAIALGILATAALVTTVIFFSGGAGAIAIGAGIGALVAKIGIGGVVGFALGIAATASLIGFFSGVRAGSRHNKLIAPSHTANMHSTVDLLREMPPGKTPAPKRSASSLLVTETPALLTEPTQTEDHEERGELRLSRK
jgi:hypothetical protein